MLAVTPLSPGASTYQGIRSFRENNMGKADFHIHTNHSDGISSVEDVLTKSSEKGLDVIAITDHNEIKGALEAKKIGSEYGLEVIVGEEISTSEGHVLGLFLTEKIERDLSPEETISSIHQQGGVAIVAHPFARFPKSLSEQILNSLLKPSNSEFRPDGLEAANGAPWNFRRRQSLFDLASRSRLAACSGSDSHGSRSVGCCYTIFEGKTAEDLKRSILSMKTQVGGTHWPYLETIRTIGNDVFYRSRKHI